MWRKCVGVEPTGRQFPDVPLALKARRVTGPYSLPHQIIEQPSPIQWILNSLISTTVVDFKDDCQNATLVNVYGEDYGVSIWSGRSFVLNNMEGAIQSGGVSTSLIGNF